MDSGFSNEQKWLMTVSLLVLAVVAIGITLLYASSVLIPFVFAVFISFFLSPILDFQVLKLNIPRSVAFSTTIFIVIGFLIVISMLVVKAVQTIVSTAGRYSKSFVTFSDTAFEHLAKWGVNVDPNAIIGKVQNSIIGVAGTVFDLSSGALFVTFFVVFLLLGRNPKVVQKGIYGNIDHQIRRYIAIKAVVSVVTGVLVWLVMLAFGLELAGVFGMLAFMLNFVPNIGSIIATLLPLPIAFAQYNNLWMISLVILIPGAIQMIIGNIIEPRFMGKSMHLHPVTILLALSFWGLTWGIMGMFLAVPITAIIRIICMQYETFRPIGNLLAGKLPEMNSNES